jgi:soluble lytic murein transglycosylase
MARRWGFGRALLAGACTVAFLYGGLVLLRVLYPIAYLPMILAAAEREGLDPALICAVVRAESRFHRAAVSARGAVGLMQIMPDTGASIAEELDVEDYAPSDLQIPEVNVRFGAWYLRKMLDHFATIDGALAAYNAGPTRVEAWSQSGASPFPSTAAYVLRVTRAIPIYRLYLRCPTLVQITPSLLF